MILPPLLTSDLEHVLAHTRSLWDELRGRRLFITGGTGFFGIWLLESFAHANRVLNLNAKVVVLSRSPAAFLAKLPHLASESCLEFIEGDVRNFAFPDGRFSHVIHAATEASARLNDEAPQEMLDVIIGGTRHVLDFAAQAGVEKLLLTSSGAVYGRQPLEITHVPEDFAGAPDPLSPGSAYGEGKRVAEHLCAVDALRFCYEVKVARCFAFVGPHLPLDSYFAIGNFIRDALAGGPIRITGDGTPFRSYLYAADLALWLWSILFRGKTAVAYNVGSSCGISIRELASLVGCIFDVSVNEPMHPSRGNVPVRYVPSVDRGAMDLGLRQGNDLRSAIEKTAAWYRLLANRQIK